MGKLNIAHHKSYHPYRRDNIERVRKDEEEARLKEEKEDGRMMLADSEARITLLRERAGVAASSKSKRRQEEERERELLAQATNADTRRNVVSSVGPSSLSSSGLGKHINLFEELEQSAISTALIRSGELDKLAKGKGKEIAETEKGVPLAPSVKDLKPWYSEKARDPENDGDDPRRTRDLSHKSRSDPLTAIQRELASRFSSSCANSPSSSYHPNSTRRREWIAPFANSEAKEQPGVSTAAPADPARSTREARESSERARALALIARKKRELVGSATPSTVRGDADEDAFRYGDQFNSRAVAEAHRRRDGPDVWERGWNRERVGERVREKDWYRGSRDQEKARW